MFDTRLFPASCLNAALNELLASEASDLHGYTPASGLLALREALRDAMQPLSLPISSDKIYVTCGAAAGRAILVRALLDEGDEVLFLYPPEDDFRSAVEAAGAVVVANGILTERTRLVVLSDHDPVPSGLDDFLRSAEKVYGHPVYLLADLLNPSDENLALLRSYDSIVLNEEFGDDFSGENIGFLAVGDHARDAELLYAAIAGAARACGYVNPPSLMQRAILKTVS